MLQVSVSEEALTKAGYVDTNKFSHVYVSCYLVSKILGVSPTTILAYAEQGLIERDEKNKINLAYALKLDFKELNTKYKQSR